MTRSLKALGLCMIASGCVTAPAPDLTSAPSSLGKDKPSAAIEPIQEVKRAPSLWSVSPTALLSMRRAKEVGDLLTVVVNMNDQARLQSSLSRTRDTSDNVTIDALLGLPEWAQTALPGGSSLSPAVDLSRNSTLDGTGAVNRTEQVAFRLAARVVGVETNGNLVIQGFQQTQVSGEVRFLSVSGVIRAQDITRTNTVSYDKIADADLSYISRGEATGPVERRALAKILDWVIPF